MKKYSCSYNGINPNFVISGFMSDKNIDKTLSGILDILSNILMRRHSHQNILLKVLVIRPNIRILYILSKKAATFVGTIQ